jgi:hypothetical protein
MTRLFLGVLVLFSASWIAEAKAENPDCEPQLLAQLQLHVSPAGGVFVPASIGGKEVFFQLSIGSGLSWLFESSVKSLGLKAKRRNGGAGMTYDGKRITHYVALEGLKLGDFGLNTRLAPILPQPEVESPQILEGKLVLGIMGSTLFRNVDAELFLAERRLKLFKPFRCMSRSPVYWGGEVAELPLHFDAAGTLVFILELDGKKVEASLLTGGRASMIDVNATRQFFGFDEASAGVEVVQVDGEAPRSLFHAMSLTGRGLGIKDAKVRLASGPSCKLSGSTAVYGAIGYSDCINVVPFRLGTDLLSQLRIYISRVRETLYVSSVEQPLTGDFGTISIVPSR